MVPAANKHVIKKAISEQVGANPESSSKSVIELLHILGLSLKADVRVETLSGGELKRLSIGMGMVSGKCPFPPSIVICYRIPVSFLAGQR